MSFENLLVRSVTVDHPGTTTDRYGNAIEDWSTATSSTYQGWVSQGGGQLVQGERIEGVQTNLTLFLLPDASIAAGDRVTVDTETFQVNGPPNVAWSATAGAPHHIEAELQRMEG